MYVDPSMPFCENGKGGVCALSVGFTTRLVSNSGEGQKSGKNICTRDTLPLASRHFLVWRVCVFFARFLSLHCGRLFL